MDPKGTAETIPIGEAKAAIAGLGASLVLSASMSGLAASINRLSESFDRLTMALGGPSRETFEGLLDSMTPSDRPPSSSSGAAGATAPPSPGADGRAAGGERGPAEGSGSSASVSSSFGPSRSERHLWELPAERTDPCLDREEDNSGP